MKKILLCLCISAGIHIQAQTEQAAFSIGPTIGGAHAFLTGNDNQFNAVWNVGLSAIYAPREHWGIGGDLRFSSEGSKIKTATGADDIRLSYMRIPIKGIYFFGVNENDFRPKITLGPSFGVLVDESGSPLHANKFDFGLNGSLGFNYRLMNDFWLNVDANYYQGLMKVREKSSASDMNGNIGLQVGLLFGL